MENESLLDDNTIVRKTPPLTVTLGTFYRNIIHRLSINLRKGSETVSTNDNTKFDEWSIHKTRPAPIMLKILPIILSRISKNFCPLFF